MEPNLTRVPLLSSSIDAYSNQVHGYLITLACDWYVVGTRLLCDPQGFGGQYTEELLFLVVEVHHTRGLMVRFRHVQVPHVFAVKDSPCFLKWVTFHSIRRSRVSGSLARVDQITYPFQRTVVRTAHLELHRAGIIPSTLSHFVSPIYYALPLP